MTLNTLLAFMVISQIAVSAYLLYSFNTIERASRRRHEALAAHVDESLAALEGRLSGVVRPRVRATPAEAAAEAELLQPSRA